MNMRKHDKNYLENINTFTGYDQDGSPIFSSASLNNEKG